METHQSAQSLQFGKVSADDSVVNMEVDDTVVIDDQHDPKCNLDEDELCQVGYKALGGRVCTWIPSRSQHVL